jgi:uncharacterized protein YndB with AHSA1/START domain
MKIEKPDGQALVITRIFDAPRELVYETWTHPERAKNWWGCKEYPASHMEMDVRPGGVWRAWLRSTEGGELRLGGQYREVVAPERLVFTFAWDEDNQDGPAGIASLVTVTFTEQAGKTLMHFHQSGFTSMEQCDNHQAGWTNGFAQLDELLHSCQITTLQT